MTFLYAAARTPFGRFDGALAGVRPDDLAAAVMEGVPTTPAVLAGLRLSFRTGGTITAGNASPLSDGASAVLLGSERATSVIGASGSRILASLAKVRRERRERRSVAAVCIGAGQGLAVVLENLAGAA